MSSALLWMPHSALGSFSYLSPQQVQRGQSLCCRVTTAWDRPQQGSMCRCAGGPKRDEATGFGVCLVLGISSVSQWVPHSLSGLHVPISKMWLIMTLGTESALHDASRCHEHSSRLRAADRSIPSHTISESDLRSPYHHHGSGTSNLELFIKWGC